MTFFSNCTSKGLAAKGMKKQHTDQLLKREQIQMFRQTGAQNYIKSSQHPILAVSI